MSTREYRNKAFLSYRHVEKDEKLADLIQKKLEQTRLPGKTSGKGAFRGVGRIFRDTTDLGARADLTAELRRELEDSEYMIVLCSAAAVGSKWIAREIRYFLKFHDAGKILPVLVDKEPGEVLPAIFGGMEGMPRHPIACDFRGNRRQAVRTELPRLAAALLGCSYDELVDRRRRYETARLAAAAAGAALLLSAVASYYAFTSAQIRRSYRERQIGESESLAVQSETALSRRLRLDAVRYALDALPEKEGDRPVVEQAVLALQKATKAYVPEGNRALAQTGEFTAPGPVYSFMAREIGGTTYLSACCEKAGIKKAMLWNADTGELVYGPEGKPETAGKAGKNGPDAASAAEGAVPAGTGSGTGRDQQMFLAQDILLQSEEGELWTDYGTLRLTGETAKLKGIDVRTGDLLWEAEDESVYSWLLYDARDGVAAVLAQMYRPSENVARAWVDPDALNEIRARNGAPVYEACTELQLRSTKDGSLLCRRQPGPEPDGMGQGFIETVLAGGRREPTLIVEQGTEAERLYALDPATGEERLLLSRQGSGAIQALCRMEDGNVLAAVCKAPASQEPYGAWTGWRFDQDEVRYYFAGNGKECFTLCCISLQTGEVLWEEKSSCTQRLDVRILADLQINERRACVFCAGTRAEVFAQDTGESLYSFDFPALPACILEGDAQETEMLEAVLKDGSMAWYCFRDGRMYQKDSVFPGDIQTARKEGDRFFLLCRADTDKALNDRICIFGEDVFDTTVVSLVDSKGQRIRGDLLDTHSADASESPGLQTAAGGMFLLEGLDGRVRGVDAGTGKTLWEAFPGENIECAGFAKDSGAMVYYDHVLDGSTAAQWSREGRKLPEETWKILHVEDGRVETVRNLARGAFGDRLLNITYFSVGGDSLVLSARCGNKQKEGEEECWLLRYGLSDGKTETVCLSGAENVPDRENNSERENNCDRENDSERENNFDRERGGLHVFLLSQSPDGNSSYVHCIREDETQEDILLDWRTRRIIKLQDPPQIDGTSAIAWSGDSSRIGFLGTGKKAALYLSDGTKLRLPSEEGSPCGIGFWEDSLVLIDVTGMEIHFRIPEKGINVLLPAGKQEQVLRLYANLQREVTVWDLPGGKILLQYESEAFVFDPQTGALEAVIENAAAYDPETDTLLLFDKEYLLCLSKRYGWEDLAEKGREALRGCR